MKILYPAVVIAISQLPATLAESNEEPIRTMQDKNVGQVYKLSGDDGNGGELFACIFEMTSGIGADLELSVTARGNWERGKGKLLCSMNEHHKHNYRVYKPKPNGYGGRYQRKRLTMYKLAKKEHLIRRFFGVNSESELTTEPVENYDDQTRTFKIINKSRGKMLKLELYSQNQPGVTVDRTGDLNAYGDAYACPEYWHLNTETRICEENVCNCDNGTGISPCAEHDSHTCGDCDAGYWVNNGAKCQKNVCKCVSTRGISHWTSLGEPAAWEDCPTHGMNKCVSCKPGLTLDSNNHCGDENTFCWCRSGVPFPAGHDECLPFEPAWSSGLFRESCQTCNDGYHLQRNGAYESMWTWKEWGCHRNVCNCGNRGGDAEGEDCPEHGGPQCEWCYSGYKKNDNGVCVTNECTCPNGIPATGMDCYIDGLRRCAPSPNRGCNEGYERDYYGYGGHSSGYSEWGCKPL